METDSTNDKAVFRQIGYLEGRHEDMATKTDVERVRTEIANVRTEIAKVKGDTTTEIAYPDADSPIKKRPSAHTNGMESFRSLLKRGYTGAYRHVSPKHLHRFVGEFGQTQRLPPQHR